MADDLQQYYFSCMPPVLACFILSVFYVSSLYVWNSPHNRDHPTTIKRRFCSVFTMMFVSPLFLYMFTQCDKYSKQTIWELLGLRWQGFFLASTLPLVLTMILFLGPLTLQGLSGLCWFYTEPMYWVANVRSLVWLRNYLVAPLSEEFTFRACMLPLLLQCFQPIRAVFICPLFFGVAHLHHISDRLKAGLDLKRTLLISCFQFFYTTLFGAYSAYLFLRTGHFVAPFLAHVFCNHMGFPDFLEVISMQEPRRSLTICVCVIGLLSWCFLLEPLTNPHWYGNNIFYNLTQQKIQ